MTSTPSASSRSAFRRGPVSIGGWEPGPQHLDRVRVEGDDDARHAELAGPLDRPADDPLVAPVDAVEDPDRHDAPAPARRRGLDTPPALHAPTLPRVPPSARWSPRRGRTTPLEPLDRTACGGDVDHRERAGGADGGRGRRAATADVAGTAAGRGRGWRSRSSTTQRTSGRGEDHHGAGCAVAVLDERDAAAVRGEGAQGAGRAGRREPLAVRQRDGLVGGQLAAGEGRRRRRRRAGTSASCSACCSSVRACARSNGPTRVRRSAVRWPPTPSAAPRSRASARTYVPEVHSTVTSSSSPRRASSVEARHDDRSGGQLDLLAGADAGVRPDAVDLDRRHGRRHLRRSPR